MSHREQRWVVAFSILLMILTSLPYIAGYHSTGTDWAFSGLLIGVEDGNSYLAKMLRGGSGDWLFRTPYTTQPQAGVLTFLPYLLLGKLAGGPAIRLQLVGLFHLFRLAGTFIYVWAIYQFVAYFLESKFMRRWATILASIGGGLGWIILLFVGDPTWQELPLSFISPETFGFLSILAVPHLAVARGLLLISLISQLKALKSEARSASLPILILLTFLFNPLAGVTLVLILGSFNLARLGAASRNGAWLDWWSELKIQFWAIALAIPYVAYLGYSYSRQPFLRAWSEQNLILSPPPGYYALAYGPLLLPAIGGLVSRRRQGGISYLFIASWMLILPVLAYLPVGVQRRLTEGGWVALVVAAAWGLSRINSGLRRKASLWSISLLAVVSPLLLLWGMWRTATQPAQPAFIPLARDSLFRHLSGIAANDDIVIADFRSSNELPSYAPVRVPIGHGPESVNGRFLEGVVNNFLESDSSADRIEFLARQEAEWVIINETDGPTLASGGPWQLSFEADEFHLFQVLVDS